VNRRLLATGVVGVLVGLIVGYFAGQLAQPPATGVARQQDEGLPSNHPSQELMTRVQHLLEHAREDPQDRDARVQLADIFYDMQRFDAAIPWYEEALALDPKDVHVSTDLGTAYLYTGELEKALERYRESLELEPNHPQTLQNLGIAHFSTGDYQRAINIWEELLSANPDYPHAADITRQIETARSHLTGAAAAQ
jgi:cytochrome c-type biogenesis protein CcmH/NrfG